jgi:hypothetical protein
MKTEWAAAKSAATQDERNQAFAKIAWGAMDVPDTVEKAINEMSSGSVERESLIQTYAQVLAGNDPDAALAWANSLGNKQEIEIARAEIAETLRGTDPKRAISLLPDSGTLSNGLSPTAEVILQNWTTKNASEALMWVAGRTKEKERGSGFTTVLDQLIHTNPETALKWVQFQGNFQLRAEAVEAIAKAVVNDLPEIRAQILEQADPAVRKELEEKLTEILPTPSAQPESEPTGE